LTIRASGLSLDPSENAISNAGAATRNSPSTGTTDVSIGSQEPFTAVRMAVEEMSSRVAPADVANVVSHSVRSETISTSCSQERAIAAASCALAAAPAQMGDASTMTGSSAAATAPPVNVEATSAKDAVAATRRAAWYWAGKRRAATGHRSTSQGARQQRRATVRSRTPPVGSTPALSHNPHSQRWCVKGNEGIAVLQE
jgi:hypothetical protein